MMDESPAHGTTTACNAATAQQGTQLLVLQLYCVERTRSLLLTKLNVADVHKDLACVPANFLYKKSYWQYS